jgi:ferredoxin-nitrite reductase
VPSQTHHVVHSLMLFPTILCIMQDVITNFGKGRADLANLPRKINICISPSRDDFPHTHINDLGFQAVLNDQGEVAFNVEVGGYFSIKRNTMSIPLGVSIKPDQVCQFPQNWFIRLARFRLKTNQRQSKI